MTRCCYIVVLAVNTLISSYSSRADGKRGIDLATAGGGTGILLFSYPLRNLVTKGSLVAIIDVP